MTSSSSSSSLSTPPKLTEPAHRWSVERAQEWYKSEPYRVGTTFIPSSARNQLEMWMDPVDWTTIEKELRWAKDQLGFNAVRVFLHDLMWQNEKDEFFQNKVDRFLGLADRLDMRTVLVVLESVGNPMPKYVQTASDDEAENGDDTESAHDNGHGYKSYWLQSPGISVLKNEVEQYAYLQPYVEAVVSKYGHDDRVLMLDLWNDPFAPTHSSIGGTAKSHATKQSLVARLLPRVLEWARGVGDIDVPLTIGITKGASYQASTAWNYILKESDVLTFHNLQDATKLEQEIQALRRSYQHPIVCLEFLARQEGSTFEPNLKTLVDEQVWAFSSGLVKGKARFFAPPGKNIGDDEEPDLWYQDILRPDGTPYLQDEVDYISQVLGAVKPASLNKDKATEDGDVEGSNGGAPSLPSHLSIHNATHHDVVHARDVDDDFKDDDNLSDINVDITDGNSGSLRGNSTTTTTTLEASTIAAPSSSRNYNRIWVDVDTFVAVLSSVSLIVVAYLARRRVTKSQRDRLATAAKLVEARSHSMRFDMDFEDDSVDSSDEMGNTVLSFSMTDDRKNSNYALDLTD